MPSTSTSTSTAIANRQLPPQEEVAVLAGPEVIREVVASEPVDAVEELEEPSPSEETHTDEEPVKPKKKRGFFSK